MPGIKVQKKDGHLEDFDRSKVSNGVVKAGASLDQAESIANQTETWARDAAVNGVISSSNIRTKALELLRVVDSEAATRYETYQKPA